MHFGTLQTSLTLQPGSTVSPGQTLTLVIAGGQPNATVQVQSTPTVDPNGNPITGGTPVILTLGNTDASGGATFSAIASTLGSWNDDVYIGGSYAGSYQFMVSADGASSGLSTTTLGIIAVAAVLLLRGKGHDISS